MQRLMAMKRKMKTCGARQGEVNDPDEWQVHGGREEWDNHSRIAALSLANQLGLENIGANFSAQI